LRGWIGYFVTLKHRACCKALRNEPGTDWDRRSGSSRSAGRNNLLNSCRYNGGQRPRSVVVGKQSAALATALPNAYFASSGIPPLTGRR
jgi:hypothetical protein